MKRIFVVGLSIVLAASLQAASHIITYPSTDQHGEKVMLSGKVSYPDQISGNWADVPVIFAFHGTQFANKDVPSGFEAEDFKSLGTDKIYIMPDYIGYGSTSDRVHPYMYDELTARNSIDMLPVAFNLLDSLGVKHTDSLTIVGFSQGAAAGLWALQMLEKDYADKYPIRKALLGGGSYDVLATYEACVSKMLIDLPALMPYLIMGMSEAYDLNFKVEDFFCSMLVQNYEKWFLSKEFGLKELFFIMAIHNVDYWTTPMTRNDADPRMKALTQALKRSSIVNHPLETVKAPLYLFHSTNDKVVPFINAKHLLSVLPVTPNITTDFGAYGNHMMASSTFYKKIKPML